MSEVLERLRRMAEVGRLMQEAGHTPDRMEMAFMDVYREAERLEAEGEQLRAAARNVLTDAHIVPHGDGTVRYVTVAMLQALREALEAKSTPEAALRAAKEAGNG